MRARSAGDGMVRSVCGAQDKRGAIVNHRPVRTRTTHLADANQAARRRPMRIVQAAYVYEEKMSSSLQASRSQTVARPTGAASGPVW